MSFCIKLVINISPCAWYWTFFFTKGVNLPFIRNMIKWPFYILFSNLGHILKIKKGRQSIAICMREASKFIDSICWRFFKVIASPPSTAWYDKCYNRKSSLRRPHLFNELSRYVHEIFFSMDLSKFNSL